MNTPFPRPLKIKARGLHSGLRRFELDCILVASSPNNAPKLTARHVRELLPSSRRALLLRILIPLFPWPESNPFKWLETRRIALVTAWRRLPASIDRAAIGEALAEVAIPARNYLLDGAARERERLRLEEKRRQNGRRLNRRLLKMARAWVDKGTVKTFPDGSTVFESAIRRIVRRHPELALVYPDASSSLFRRETADDLARFKKATTTRLEASGLKGRKFSDVRALLLLAAGLIRTVDPKMLREHRQAIRSDARIITSKGEKATRPRRRDEIAAKSVDVLASTALVKSGSSLPRAGKKRPNG